MVQLCDSDAHARRARSTRSPLWRPPPSRANRSSLLNSMARFVTVVVVASLSAVSAAQTSSIGLFLGPPVPVASMPYTITINSVADGPPVSVANVTIAVNGSFVDTTIFLDHGSSFFTPAPFQTVQGGPSVPSGAYTFRYFTKNKYPGDATYEPASDVLGSANAFVTDAQNVVDAVEYYNAPRNHYFLTASATDIALLDAGVFQGWTRTGQKFLVYLTDPSMVVPSPLSPVCRYYGLPSAGLDTHFFSASPADCAIVMIMWPTQWVLETPNAFYVYLPNIVDGSCPDGTMPVYRLYNNRPDVNHRYTTSLAIRQQMIDAGWIPEGYGNLSVAMCVIAS